MLLDAVSCALRNVESVQLDELPRRADFATWVTAAEEALGWEPGSFMAAHAGNYQAATEALLEADPVADAVMRLLTFERMSKGSDQWQGTSAELLVGLSGQVGDDVKRTKSWPKAPHILSRHLNRLAPSLREVGIEYSANQEGHAKTKIKTLRWVREDSAALARRQGEETQEPLDESVYEEDDDDFEFPDS